MMMSYILKSVKMIIEEQIAQVHGMSLVLKHEVSEDNIIQNILNKEFIK